LSKAADRFNGFHKIVSSILAGSRLIWLDPKINDAEFQMPAKPGEKDLIADL
jgi:hypothetical protein